MSEIDNPFVFFKSINEHKKNLFREASNIEDVEKNYLPFIINKGLSQYPDTIFYANEMNIRWELDKQLQYEYYLYFIRKGKRWTKWAKKSKMNEDVKLIQEYFGYSMRKALVAFNLFSKTDLKKLRKKFDRGGANK